MLLRVKNRPSKKVVDVLSNPSLPRHRLTSLHEYNGVVLDVNPDDCRELMESLEDLGFENYAEDEDELPSD